MHLINPKDDATRLQLLEYMYYVDGHHDAHMDTVGALARAAAGVIGIMTLNPMGITLAIITLSSAEILDVKAYENKNLCYSYAHKIADKIIGRCR